MGTESIVLAETAAPGLIAIPESGSGPGVVVIQEWWGLVPHIEDVTRRLADAGFVALAIDFYRGTETTEPDEAEKLMMGLQVSRAAADIAAGAAYLVNRPEVTSARVGTIGFCMGGGLSLLAPTVSDHVAAAVAFYPAMPWPEYAPDWVHYAGKAALIHKAESDEGWAGPRIAEYADAIAAAGGHVTIHEYPGSVHAFFNDDRPEVFQERNAQSAWNRSLAFLREHCPST